MGFPKIAFRLSATTLIIATFSLAALPHLPGAAVVALQQVAGLASLDRTALILPRALLSSARHFRYGRLLRLSVPLAPARQAL